MLAITRKDFLIAGGLGLFVFGLLAVFSYPIAAPAAWQPLSEATGLLPPDNPIPGLWRMLVGSLAKCVGMGAIDRVLVWLGHAAAGVCTACAYLVIGNVMLSLEQLAQRRRIEWSRHVLYFITGFGTLLFAFAGPVWRMGQTFLPSTFALLLTMPALLLFVLFIRTGRLLLVGFSVAIFGVLAGETAAGILLGTLALVGTYFSSLFGKTGAQLTFMNLVVRFVSMWRLIGVFLLGYVLTVTANCLWFVRMGGLEAHDWQVVDMVIEVFHLNSVQVTTAATPLAWFAALFLVGVPFTLTVYLLRRASDDDKFLRYGDALIILGCGVTAFLQLSCWSSFWFWTWPAVRRAISDYLLGFFMLMNVLTVTFAVCVFCSELFFRNYRRLANEKFPDDSEEDAAQRLLASIARQRRFFRRLFWGILVVLLLAVIPGVPLSTEREMLGIVDDYLEQVVDEAGDAEVLFTDGRLDRGVELRAAAHGKRLVTLSFLEDNSFYHQTCRKRGGKDAEDRDMLAFGSADLLRAWVYTKQARLSAMATQIGLELWKRQGYVMPTCAGLLARTVGFDATAVARGRERAWALAERIRALRRDNPRLKGNADRLLEDLLLYIQWRVAWFCHRRSELADLANDLQLAEEEEKLGTDLDEVNPALARMRQKTDALSVLQTGRLMPREGLRLGLERMDFVLARQYAQKVLQTDPNYSPANFAMGMSFLKEEQYNKAASYLRRCVEKDPNDVSAWNNLAVVYQRQGSLDEALAAAERAVEAAQALKTPQVRERAVKDVNRTLRYIQRLREKK